MVAKTGENSFLTADVILAQATGYHATWGGRALGIGEVQRFMSNTPE